MVQTSPHYNESTYSGKLAACAFVASQGGDQDAK